MATSDYEMDSDVEEQARSLTTCSICMDKFEDPKVLPCQHSFCLRCIKLCFESTNKQRLVPVSNFPCPTCRKLCYIPQRGVEFLATDFRIGQILDLLSAIENSIQLQQQKQVCEGETVGFGSCSICRFQKRNRIAEAFCLQCEKSFCKECLEQHNSTTIFQEHSLINAHVSKQSEVNNMCSNHDYELKYYCEQCQRLMCTVCVLSEHAGHTLIDQTNAYNRFSTTLNSFAADFSTKRIELGSKLESLQQVKLDYAKACQDGEEMIRKAASDAKLKLLHLENELLTNINSIYNEKCYAITCYEETLCQGQENVRRISDNIAQALQVNGIKLFFDKYTDVCSQVDKYVPINLQNNNLNDHILFTPNVNISLGEIKSETFNDFEESMDSSIILRNHEDLEDRPVEIVSRKRDSQGNHLQNNHHFLKNSFLKFGDKDASKNCGSDRIIGGLERRLSGRLSLSSSLSGSALTGNRKKLKWISDNFMSCRDCCFVNLSGKWHVYASEYHKSCAGIKIFDLKGKLLNVINLRAMTGPWSLVFSQSSKSIVVADHLNRAIRMIKLDSYGNCNKMITIAQLDTVEPRGLAITNEGDYVISDSQACRSSSIYVYSNSRSSSTTHYSSSTAVSLTKRSDFAKLGDNEGEILLANYLVVDRQNRIVVADAASHHVKVFSMTGQQLVKFSCSCSFDGKDMVPQGLAVDSNNNILVADQATCNVSMYNPDGQLISSVVTTRGAPWGISYLEEEKLLAVCTDKGLEMYSLKVI